MDSEVQKAQYIKYFKAHVIQAVFGAVGLVLIVFSFRPMINAIKTIPTLLQEALSKKEETAQIKGKIAVLQNSNNQELSLLLKEAQLALPSEKDAGEILAAFEYLRSESGVELGDISLSPGLVSTQSAQKVQAVSVVDIPGVFALDFSINIKGRPDVVFPFIKKITEVRRLFGIHSMRVAFFEDGLVVADLGLFAYFAPTSVESMSTDAALEQFTAADRNTLQKVSQFPLISEIGSGGDRVFDDLQRIDFFTPGVEPSPESTIAPEEPLTE